MIGHVESQSDVSSKLLSHYAQLSKEVLVYQHVTKDTHLAGCVPCLALVAATSAKHPNGCCLWSLQNRIVALQHVNCGLIGYQDQLHTLGKDLICDTAYPSLIMRFRADNSADVWMICSSLSEQLLTSQKPEV